MKTIKSRQVVVDCQLLQTQDRNRGMGLYLHNLLSTLAKTSSSDDIEWSFLINENLPDLSAEDVDMLNKLGETMSNKFLTRNDCSTFQEASSANRKLVDESISIDKKTNTTFFIPALFSSEIYPVFPSRGTSNLMLFHDIIPFLYYEHYFRDHEGHDRIDYAQRFREVYRTDLFVTNSQTTADDLIVYFGIDPSRIVPILGSGSDRDITPVVPKSSMGISEDFILMPSGDDYRKNNHAAVSAFASLNLDTQLVITSNFSSESQRTLSDICPNIIFTGSVSDQEYEWLMNNAKFVFFPSEYEGLGMPVLEAIKSNAIVVCSNIPVFAEISSDAFFYFDPKSTASISEALKSVLNMKPDDKQITSKKKLYKDIIERFSWPITSERFINALDVIVPAQPRKKIAIFIPSPSSYSAVGKFALEVHAELSRFYDIDYFAENGQTDFKPSRPNILEYATGYYPATTFDKVKDEYDRVLYNVGNSEFHVQTILNSLRLPGNVIVHDTQLKGIFDYMQRNGYLTTERRQYEDLLNDKLGLKLSSCISSIVNNQNNLFCHSAYSTSAVKEATVKGVSPGVSTVMLPIGVPVIELKKPEHVTISFAGIISEDKGINLVSQVSKLPNVYVKVFGFGVLGDSPLLQQLGPNVEVIKDLSDKEFQDALKYTDILVNYRINYNGETSKSTLEAMRYGATVLVRDVGWYGELPDEVVAKVKTEVDVIKTLSELANSAIKRRDIGRSARNYLLKNYTYSKYAQDIYEKIEGSVK